MSSNHTVRYGDGEVGGWVGWGGGDKHNKPKKKTKSTRKYYTHVQTARALAH